jgi:predicted dehydrogenase
MFAAAAVVVANPLRSLAAENQEGRKRGPNDRIRVACIGFNGQGKGHIKTYAEMGGAEIVYLCDVDSNLFPGAVKMVEEKGKKAPKCVQDLREVFDDKSVDVVSIATPNHWHALAAIWAMQAGKDVYVEKPVSHNVSEGRRMVQVARKLGRICQTGTQCRSMKGSIDAIRYVHEGKIGKVTVARGLCYKGRGSIGLAGDDQPVPEGIDYDIWLGPAPKKPVHRKRFHYDWHWFWDYGSGDLGNQGIHQMDLARWGLKKNALPKAAFGLGGRFGYKDDGETPNTHLTFCDYGDCQLIFETRGLKTSDYKGANVGVVFHGTEGYVVLTDYTAGAAFDLEGKLVKKFEGGGDHFGNFLSAVRSRKHTDLHADIAEGHLSSALCHLGNVSYVLGTDEPFSGQSKAFGDNKEAYETFARMQEHVKDNQVPLDGTTYKLGKKLTINPKTETFIGDAKANELLTREYRKPYVVPATV